MNGNHNNNAGANLTNLGMTTKIKQKRRIFNEDFKHQMVSLYQHGKSRSEIVAEYDLTPSALERWITQAS
jgi:transposase